MLVTCSPCHHFCAPFLRTVAFQMGERLPKWLRKMRFVEDDERVGASEASVDGGHFWADAVATKEKPGTELIDGGEADRGLNWRLRPCRFERHAAAHGADVQKLIGTAALPQGAPNGFQVRVLLDGLANGFRTAPSFIHYQTPIHHEEDAGSRSCPTTGQCINGDVYDCGLSCRSGHRDGFRPSALLFDPACECRLPGEWGPSAARERERKRRSSCRYLSSARVEQAEAEVSLPSQQNWTTHFFIKLEPHVREDRRRFLVCHVSGLTNADTGGEAPPMRNGPTSTPTGAGNPMFDAGLAKARARLGQRLLGAGDLVVGFPRTTEEKPGYLSSATGVTEAQTLALPHQRAGFKVSGSPGRG